MKIDYVKDGNVISIAAARTDMRFPAVSRAEAYWKELCAGRLMPNRSDVDPRGISSILEHAFILEKIAPGMAKIRLAGQAINDVLGMEMRGMPISALFSPEARHEIQAALENLFDGPATVNATLVSEGGYTRKRLEGQLFLAPLRDDKGRITRAFGALQLREEVDRAPRRFTFQDLRLSPRLTEDALPARPAPSAPPAYRQIPGFAEHAQGNDLRQTPHNDAAKLNARPATTPSSTEKVVHLRLVDQD